MSSQVQQRFDVLRTRLDYQGALLGILCALVTFILMVGSDLTHEPISARLMEDRLQNLQQVLPAANYDNDPLADTLTLHDDISANPITVYVGTLNHKLNAVAYEITSNGYGGEMQLIMGVKANGEILGLRVVAHKETPGLADKIEIDKSDWVLSFNGKSLTNLSAAQWKVKKDGGEFDQFTGATITPRAIVGSVHQYLEFYTRHQAELEQFVAQKTATPAEEQP